MANHLQVRWIDAGREPACKPNPAYPDGIDLDLRTEPGPSCSTPLPYPARRCGSFIVRCAVCGLRVAVTTAGRPDDPRSLAVTCKIAVAA